MSNIVCFGEVLWDVFPNRRTIGGAPLNVALRLQSFGHEVSIITKIGDDEDGDAILKYINDYELDSTYIQKDTELATSSVEVKLDSQGSATYIIHKPRAWDKIALNQNTIERVKQSDAFIYGSLASRSQNTKETLFQLLEVAPYKIFDVNLRKPHYTYQLIKDLMKKADFIKFNDDEIFEICEHLSGKQLQLEDAVLYISKYTNTKTICVTLGANGALIYINNIFYYNEGYSIEIEDTVGAGDSFLASLVHQLLNKNSPQKAIDYASAVGALVASYAGANPKISNKEIEEFINVKTQ
ncbi:carbohydrate kinase [Gaetbulibacter jejuensis]|uniref:Carbohydrate kinase n=1 Tax=Gaetbulibacter jejuensis TaxID=584607 RepID=A0ABP3UYY6_9FLAO